MSLRAPTRSFSTSSSQRSEDSTKQKSMQSMVTCVYQAHIAGFWRNVTVLWTKNVMNYALNISVESVEPDQEDFTCKIELKPWHFWAKRGFKTFEVDRNQVEVYWDLRSAKFSGGPEPCKDFYVALVSEEETALLLGDWKKKAYKRTNTRSPLVEAILYYKKEHVFGKKSFSTRAKFDQHKREHDIVVESSTTGPREPEMWISIDGIVLIHIRNLQWKFRGNQTVLVNKQPVQVFWDVYSWLFCSPGSDYGLFIFKPGPAEMDSDGEDNAMSNDSDCSGHSLYHSVRSYSKASDLCLFLYAWKIE